MPNTSGTCFEAPQKAEDGIRLPPSSRSPTRSTLGPPGAGSLPPSPGESGRARRRSSFACRFCFPSGWAVGPSAWAGAQADDGYAVAHPGGLACRLPIIPGRIPAGRRDRHPWAQRLWEKDGASLVNRMGRAIRPKTRRQWLTGPGDQRARADTPALRSHAAGHAATRPKEIWDNHARGAAAGARLRTPYRPPHPGTRSRSSAFRSIAYPHQGE
jgi:hypothetical protein